MESVEEDHRGGNVLDEEDMEHSIIIGTDHHLICIDTGHGHTYTHSIDREDRDRPGTAVILKASDI